MLTLEMSKTSPAVREKSKAMIAEFDKLAAGLSPEARCELASTMAVRSMDDLNKQMTKLINTTTDALNQNDVSS